MMIQNILNKAGYQLIKLANEEKMYPDIEQDFWKIYRVCKPFTMTKVERLYALYQSVRYVLRKKIPGDFVECGVWKGGNPMMIAAILQEQGVTDRKIYLYDTFEGMSEPTQEDKNVKGRDARAIMDHDDKAVPDSVWCYSPLEEVQRNMASTGYPQEKIVTVKGKVEDTIPTTAPDVIALLRLDTDWYESTYHELVHLYPRLSGKGVLIIDDYGYWQGCRKAVDQYMEENNLTFLLQRIDSSARLAIRD